MAFNLSDYEFSEALGQGGFGAVYRACQKSLDRTVAIKCLSPSRIQNQDEILRFKREAQATAALSHENIITIHDYGYASGNYYIVMEYVEGLSFDNALENEIPKGLGLFVIEKICGALQCAHEKGIVHRDLKGANIFLGKNGQVKLADFGLALVSEDIRLSLSGAAVGTLAFMAPEVMVSPDDVDYRADIFSLGCILYNILSGKLPFEGNGIADTSYKILNCTPDPILCEDNYNELIPLVIQCLAKDRENRPTLQEIRSAIRSIITKDPTFTPETLALFVRNEKLQPAVQKYSSVHAPQTVNKSKTGYKILLTLSVLISIILIVGLSMQGVRSRQLNPPQLTTVSKKLTGTIQSIDSHLRDDQHSPSRFTDNDYPKPLTGEVGETRTASIRISNLSKGDSLFINESYYVLPSESTSVEIPVRSGHLRLIIRRSSGKVVTKDLEVMPYQTFEWKIH